MASFPLSRSAHGNKPRYNFFKTTGCLPALLHMHLGWPDAPTCQSVSCHTLGHKQERESSSQEETISLIFFFKKTLPVYLPGTRTLPSPMEVNAKQNSSRGMRSGLERLLIKWPTGTTQRRITFCLVRQRLSWGKEWTMFLPEKESLGLVGLFAS